MRLVGCVIDRLGVGWYIIGEAKALGEKIADSGRMR